MLSPTRLLRKAERTVAFRVKMRLAISMLLHLSGAAACALVVAGAISICVMPLEDVLLAALIPLWCFAIGGIYVGWRCVTKFQESARLLAAGETITYEFRHAVVREALAMFNKRDQEFASWRRLANSVENELRYRLNGWDGLVVRFAEETHPCDDEDRAAVAPLRRKSRDLTLRFNKVTASIADELTLFITLRDRLAKCLETDDEMIESAFRIMVRVKNVHIQRVTTWTLLCHDKIVPQSDRFYMLSDVEQWLIGVEAMIEAYLQTKLDVLAPREVKVHNAA